MNQRHLTDEELQGYLDRGVVKHPDWVKNHLEVCDHCRNELARYKQLYSGLGDDNGFELPTGFAQKVVDRIHEPVSLKRRNRYADLVFAISGLITGLGVLIYFADLKPLINYFIGFNQRQVFLIKSILADIIHFVSVLNIETDKAIYAAVVLLFTVAIDRIVFRKGGPGLRVFL